MAEKTVATTGGQSVASEREHTRAQERYVSPPVDIYETADDLVLLADLPGVESNDLDVRLEDNMLTINGKAKSARADEPTYREYELLNFFRQFELSEQIDQGKVSADLKHGVLTLHLPKTEKAKPRQIAVRVS
jgi:HSP20 family molecular chaperone IbpA